MGEIGLDSDAYLYEFPFWKLLLISRGYFQRQRAMWSAMRWQTYMVMASQVGSDGMRAARINTPADLLPLPWDSEQASTLPSEDEIKEMQQLMQNINSANEKESEQ